MIRTFALCTVLLVWSGCGAPDATRTPDADQALSLELLGESGDLPEELRLTFHNRTSTAVSFTEPWRLHPETSADGENPSPLLALVLTDPDGNDSEHSPVLTHPPEATPPPKPETVQIRPGGTWSRTYPLSSFQFWGPCGPAGDLPSCMARGSAALRVRAELHGGPDTVLRSDPVVLRCSIPAFLFESYDPAFRVREVDASMTFRPGEAIEAGEFPTEPLSELVQQLNSPDFRTRLSSAMSLREAGPGAGPAVPFLVKLLRESRDPSDRLMAAYVLGAIGPDARNAVPALMAARADENVRVREVATDSIEKVEGASAPSDESARGVPMFEGRPVTYWIQRLGELDDRRELEAYTALNYMGPKAIPYLLDALAGEESRVWHMVQFQLEQMYEEEHVSGRELIQALQSEHAAIRRGVVGVLAAGASSGWNGDRSSERDAVVAALSHALNDPDSEVRVEAARALGQPGVQVAVPALLAKLTAGTDELRSAVAEAIGDIGPPAAGAESALRELLGDDSAFVRVAAHEALEKLGFPSPGYRSFQSRIDEFASDEKIQKRSISSYDLPVGDGVFLLVDRSGSASETFEAVKGMMTKAIARLPDGIEFGIIFFDQATGRLRFPDESTPARLDPDTRKRAVQFIRKADLGSGTCLKEGLMSTLSFAESSSARKKVIVYIGDGGATCRGDPEEIAMEDAYDSFTRRNAGRAELHTVGTSFWRESFLIFLSGKNGGTYTRIEEWSHPDEYEKYFRK